MNYCLMFLCFLFSFTNILGQSKESNYVDKCKIEFADLLKMVPEQKRNQWTLESLSIDSGYIILSQDLQNEESIYNKAGASNIYAFHYINSINAYILPKETNLINKLASYVINEMIEKEILNRADSIENILTTYSNSKEATKFQKSYKNFISQKEKINEIILDTTELFSVTYEPKDNAYSTANSKEKYVVYNWRYKISMLRKVGLELDSIGREIKSSQYLIIKDPSPIFSLLFQFCTLLVLISNLLINFRVNSRIHFVIAILVGFSLITSLVLLLVSDNTILNSVINVLAPGIAYLIYYRINKK